MKKLVTLLLLLSIYPLFAQTEFIPFQSLEAAHKGTAAWNTDGSGPEAAKTGHPLPWLPPTSYAYYYIASRDYSAIDGDATAAALAGSGTITGFPSFVLALATNGFTVSDITMKYSIQTLGNDVEGVDWVYTPVTTIETRTYKGGNWVIYLDGQPMVGGLSPNMNMTIIYNDLGNYVDDQISGVTDFVIPDNLSDSSPSSVQACAAAFLNDIGNYGIRYNFASLQPAIQVSFGGNGRFGAFFIAQNGKFEKGNIALPVELTSFQAKVISGNIQLNWKTATEMNNMGFAIERTSSTNKNAKVEWNKIGFVPGNGTTTTLHEYSYLDQLPIEGVVKYRLKQIDMDGTFEYSQIVEVNFTQPKEFTLHQNYPNPFNPVTEIHFDLPVESNVNLVVFNSLGEKVATLINNVESAGSHKVSFDAASLTSGIYLYQITSSPVGANSGQPLRQIKKMLLLR